MDIQVAQALNHIIDRKIFKVPMFMAMEMITEFESTVMLVSNNWLYCAIFLYIFV